MLCLARRLFDNPIVLALMLVLISSNALAASRSGSGFFVTEDGYFVTNFHVVRDATELAIRDQHGRTLRAHVISADPVNDLAVLKVEGRFHSLAVGPSANLRRGATVVTVGYPNVDIQGYAPKVTEGIISSLSGLRDDPRTLQVTVPLQPGNSGGPLVSLEGNVVGIVSSTLSPELALKARATLPQSVNYAIKSGYLLELLASVSGLNGKLGKPRVNQFKDRSDLAAMVEKATGLVVAELSPPRRAAAPVLGASVFRASPVTLVPITQFVSSEPLPNTEKRISATQIWRDNFRTLHVWGALKKFPQQVSSWILINFEQEPVGIEMRSAALLLTANCSRSSLSIHQVELFSQRDGMTPARRVPVEQIENIWTDTGTADREMIYNWLCNQL